MDLWSLVVFLVAGMPALAYWRFTRIARRREPATTSVKLRLYLTGVLTQWGLVTYCVWVLARRGLSLSDIGWAGGAHPVIWILALVFTAALIVVTHRSILALAGESVREFPLHLRRLLRILPTNRTERTAFVVLALTAGFCEEILYRGFLIFALDRVLPHLAIAVVLSAVAFGIGHAYQGRQGMITTGVLGIVLGVLYVLGGSLWPVIFVHAVIDLGNGYLLGGFARRLQGRAPLPPEGEPPPAGGRQTEEPGGRDPAQGPRPPERFDGSSVAGP